MTSVSTADGTTTVGQVTVSQTLVNSGGNIAVPLSIGAYALGPISGSASVSVATAEAASVNDTTNYAPVGLAYNISMLATPPRAAAAPMPTPNSTDTAFVCSRCGGGSPCTVGQWN